MVCLNRCYVVVLGNLTNKLDELDVEVVEDQATTF